MISQAGQCADVGATCRKRNKILKSKRVKDFNKKAFILTLTFSAVLLIFLAEFSLAMLENVDSSKHKTTRRFLQPRMMFYERLDSTSRDNNKIENGGQ